MKYVAIFLCVVTSIAYAQRIEIENEHIKAVMDRITGEFSIGCPNGDPLLEGFPDGALSSYFTLKKDARIASNKPGLAEPLRLVDTGAVFSSRYIAISWEWDHIKIWEKLRILEQDSLKRFVYIELFMYNSSTDSQRIGAMLFLDPTLRGHNPEHIYIPAGEIDTLADFRHINVPFYWIGTDDTLFSPGFSDMYMGTFVGADIPYPDRVIFGNDEQMRSVQWDFTPSRGTIQDLGILSYWNPRTIAPGETYFIGLYFGRGYPNMNIKREITFKKPIIELSQPIPNPFNTSCRIECSNSSNVPIAINIAIFDISGKPVRYFQPKHLIEKENIVWDGKDQNGNPLPSGIYIISFSALNFNETRKLILIK